MINNVRKMLLLNDPHGGGGAPTTPANQPISGDDGDQEHLDPEKMIAALQAWEGLYDKFYSAFNEADIAVAEAVNVSASSCVFGTSGKKIYNAWEKKVLPWKNVYYMLRRMSSNVIEMIKEHKDFQEYMNHGEGQAIGGDDLIKRQTDPTRNDAANARMLAALRAGLDNIDGTPITIGPDGKFTYNGREYTVTTNPDGSVKSVTVDNVTYNGTPAVPAGYGETGAQVTDPRTMQPDNPLSTPTTPANMNADRNSTAPDRAQQLWANADQTRQEVGATADMLAQALFALGYHGRLDLMNPNDPQYPESVQKMLAAYQQYSRVEDTLESELDSGFWHYDGSFTNAIPTDYQGGQVDGVDIPKNSYMSGNNDESYARACDTADDIDIQLETLRNSYSLDDIEAALQAEGQPPLGLLTATEEDGYGFW